MPDQPTTQEINDWCRRFACDANNDAWTLAEKGSRTAVEDTRMLDAAHAARYLWSGIGNAKNHALADLLLGQVHALVGHGSAAWDSAKSAYDYLTANDSALWELAFAHAVLAHAACVAGKHDLHCTHYEQALSFADQLTDPDERNIFDASFRVIPRPGC